MEIFIFSAQKHGLLSEAHHEEVDQADPFYAHCRVHSDKVLIRNRKKNYNALIMHMKKHEEDLAAERMRNEKPTEEQERIERKLKAHRIKYATHKMNRPEPWGESPRIVLDRKKFQISIFSSNSKNVTISRHERFGS